MVDMSPQQWKQAARLAKAPWMTPQGLARGKTQQRFRNWRNFQGAQYSEDFFVYSAQVASLAPGASAQVALQINADSSFEWIVSTAGAQASANAVPANPNLTVQIVDGGSSRNLFSAPVPCNLIAGNSGQLPFINPIPRRFLSKSTVNFIFYNFDSAITYTNIEFNLIGRKIYSSAAENRVPQFNTWEGFDGQLYAEDYFVYDFNFGNVAAGATGIVTDLIEADSDFEWIQSEYGAFNNVTTSVWNYTTPATLQIQDGASNQNLFSNPIFINMITGYVGLPFILPVSRIFLGKTPVTLTLAPQVNVNSAHYAMLGRKIFRFEGG